MFYLCGSSQTKKQTKEEAVVNASKKLYKLYGLEDNVDYKIYNTPLKTLPGHISTFEAGFDNPEVLVMIHGYGASTAFHFKQFPLLCKKFHIYAMDLYGFGSSFRYQYKLKSDDEAMDLYLKSIEEWRQELNLDKFYIMGHSLGGYLTQHWLNRYKPKNIQGVFMMSPAGTTTLTEQEVKEKKDEMFKTWFKKKIGKFADYLIHDKHWSP